MEYVQERIATLHDFDAGAPPAPLERAAVVVPMTERDHATPAAEGVLSTLGDLDVGSVVLALRGDEQDAVEVRDWVRSFPVEAEVLWCRAPAVADRLRAHGLDGRCGKGRDVWLALGVAASRAEFVAVHDADATTYGPAQVPRLLFPLAHDYAFVKGYYARVEEGRLYGRLCRLLYEPAVAALEELSDAPLVEYLGAFRYGLAGEFAATSGLVRRLRAQRGWGLEVGTLGDAFETAGFADTAQVDLGIHEHDHRSVEGSGGLSNMSGEVWTALCRTLADAGVEVDFEVLRSRYRRRADALIDQYAADAAFNGLEFDHGNEREQVAAYADAIAPPGPDDRLPAWRETDLEPGDVLEASRGTLESGT